MRYLENATISRTPRTLDSADLHQASAFATGAGSAGRAGLAARDQVRWLPNARARRLRRRAAPDPHRPGLDPQISTDRRGAVETACRAGGPFHWTQLRASRKASMGPTWWLR